MASQDIILQNKNGTSITITGALTGPRGATGAGVPSGGTAGQVVKKNSSTDFDASWDTLDKTDVGLTNIDNTSDANKPVSTATQTALNGKLNATAAAGGDLAGNYPNPTVIGAHFLYAGFYITDVNGNIWLVQINPDGTFSTENTTVGNYNGFLMAIAYI